MAKKRHGAAPPPSGAAPKGLEAPGAEAPVTIYHGIVEDMEVRPPSRVVYLLAIVLLAGAAGFVHVAGSEEWSLVLAPAAQEPSERQQVQTAIDRALMLRAQGQVEESYALLRVTHERFPEEPNLNRELGRHHLDRGLWTFAQEYFELAAEKTPKNGRLNASQGELHRRWGAERERSGATGADAARLTALAEAREHYDRAAAFFDEARAGFSPYEPEPSRRSADDAREGSIRCRLERVRILAGRARGLLGSDPSALDLARRELEAVVVAPGLTPAQRKAAGELRQSIDGGRTP